MLPKKMSPPTVGNHRVEHLRRDGLHRDHADPNARDRHDAELQHLGKHDAEHATLDHVERRDRGDDQAVEIDVGCGIAGQLPGQERRGELGNADETIGQESDDIDQCEQDHDQSAPIGRRVRRRSETESTRPRSSPRNGAARPTGRPSENLIENGPQPGNPRALEPVDKQQIDHPHRAADVEHARGVGKPEQVPGNRISAEKVAAAGSSKRASRSKSRYRSSRRM